MRTATFPDGMPVLAPGHHRSPRKGACFMEFVSFLAGEKWSDHPVCVHPLLTQLAQQVNDCISDAGRQQLLPLTPHVIGRRGTETTWLTISVAVAARAIRDAPEPKQRVLAAGLVRAEQLCAEAGPDLAGTGRDARAALDLAPGATSWAERLASGNRISMKTFAKRCAPTIVRCAVEAEATSVAPDADGRLRGLLEAGMAACPRQEPVAAAPSPSPTPLP